MPTKKRRIYFTPSDESLRCLDEIAAASGVPTSTVVTELVGLCEIRLQDLAWGLASIAQMKRDLAHHLAELNDAGIPALGDMEHAAERDLQETILAAHQQVEDVAGRFRRHVTRTASTAERASMMVRLATQQPRGTA